MRTLLEKLVKAVVSFLLYSLGAAANWVLGAIIEKKKYKVLREQRNKKGKQRDILKLHSGV